MNILVVPGHYGTIGARGNGYKEEELTKVLSVKIVNELLYQGHSAVLADFNLYEKLARYGVTEDLKKFDYIIELHFNAGGGEGAEIYVPIGTKGVSVERSIMQRLSKYFALRMTTGIKEGDYLILNKLSNWPISLLEVCFIDSKSDMDTYAKNIDQIAIDIAHGILEGFEEPIKERPVEVVKTLDPAQEWTVKNMIFKDEAWQEPLTKSQMAWAIYTAKKRGLI